MAPTGKSTAKAPAPRIVKAVQPKLGKREREREQRERQDEQTRYEIARQQANLAGLEREKQALIRRKADHAASQVHGWLDSDKEYLHDIAADRIDEMKDDEVTDTLHSHRWLFAGQHLYRFVLTRPARSRGVGRVAQALQRSYWRSARQQADFPGVYEGADAVSSQDLETARKLHETLSPSLGGALTGVDGARARLLLSGRSRQAIERIVKAYAQAYAIHPGEWMARLLDRTQDSVGAYALIRGQSEASQHVKLGKSLIPGSLLGGAPENEVLGVLESQKHPQRLATQDAFDKTFAGFGPSRGKDAPDTLRGYIKLRMAARWDWYVGNLSKSLALLHHEPTPAERLFFLAPRRNKEDYPGAIALLKEQAALGPSAILKMDEDWDRFVCGGLERTSSPLTSRGLKSHLGWVFDGDERREMLSLIESSRMAVTVGVELAHTAPFGSQDPAEQQRLLIEEAQLLHHLHMLGVAQHRLADRKTWRLDEPDPFGILPLKLGWQALGGTDATRVQTAVGGINAVLEARVGRIRARLDAFDGDGRLARAQDMLKEGGLALLAARANGQAARASSLRAELEQQKGVVFELEKEKDWLTAELARRKLEADKIRKPLATDIAVGDVQSGWGKDTVFAQLALCEGFGTADEIWMAGQRHDHGKVLKLVTTAWSKRGIRKLLADCAQPRKNANGVVIRPAFEITKTIYGSPTEFNGKRVRALLHGPFHKVETAADASADERAKAVEQGHMLDDIARGVERLRIEMKDGTTDTDLARVHDFLSLPDLESSLRLEVIYNYVENDYGRYIGDPLDPFLDWMVERSHEGKGYNALRIRELLKPPKTAAEMTAHAAAVERSTRGGMHRSAAQLWGEITGDRLQDATSRALARLRFISLATEDELAPMLKEMKCNTRDELAAAELKAFENHQAEQRALENTCAQLIAGAMETALEAGLGAVTGGAGLLAVVNAFAASCVSLYAQEMMLGPDFKLWSAENLNTVLQSAVGTATVELDLREVFVKKLPVKGLKRVAGDTFHQGFHNVLNGGAETLIGAVVESGVNFAFDNKLPTNEDIARHADLMIGKMIAKVGSTPFTARNNPSHRTVFMDFGDRLKNNAVFKLSMKVTESIAKEIATMIATTGTDAAFGDELLKLAWKGLRGVVSTSVKTYASAMGQEAAAEGEKGHLEEFRAKHPDAFMAALKGVARKRVDESDKLQQEYAAAARATQGLTPELFMLVKAAGDPKTAHALHKDLLPHADAIIGAKLLPAGIRMLGGHARAFRHGTQGLDQTVRDPKLQAAVAAASSASHGEALINGMQVIDRSALDLARSMAQKGHLPPGVSEDEYAARLSRLAVKQAEADPGLYATRARAVADILHPASVTRDEILGADPKVSRKAALELVRGHGNWDQLMETLAAGGPDQQRIADKLRALRNDMLGELERGYHGRTGPRGDGTVEISVRESNTSSRKQDMEALLKDEHGAGWAAMWGIRTKARAQGPIAFALESDRAGFTSQLRSSLRAVYESDAALRQQHEAQRAAGRDISVDDFMVERASRDDAVLKRAQTHVAGLSGAGFTERRALRSGEAHEELRGLLQKMHDEARSDRTRERDREHGLTALADALAAHPPARAAGKSAAESAEADARFRQRFLARAKDHATASPDEFHHRAELVANLLDPDHPRSRRLAAGGRTRQAELEALLREHGNWKEIIELLSVGGPALEKIARDLGALRDKEVAGLSRRYGATTAKTASTEANSDVDLSLEGMSAGAKVLEGEQRMRKRWGPKWREILRMSLYTPAERANRYLDALDQLPHAEREAAIKRVTQAAEYENVVKLLRASERHPQLKQQAEALAADLGVNLEGPRKVAQLTAEQAEARRRTLMLQADEREAEYRKVSPARRVNLGLEITELQMEINALSFEANIGPGANRMVLGGTRVRGLEAYQAGLSVLVEFLDHRAQAGSERSYEPYKYIERFCMAARLAGLEGADLDRFESLGNFVNNKTLRSAMSSDWPFVPRAQQQSTAAAGDRRGAFYLDKPILQAMPQELLDSMLARFTTFATDATGRMRRKLMQGQGAVQGSHTVAVPPPHADAEHVPAPARATAGAPAGPAAQETTSNPRAGKPEWKPDFGLPPGSRTNGEMEKVIGWTGYKADATRQPPAAALARAAAMTRDELLNARPPVSLAEARAWLAVYRTHTESSLKNFAAPARYPLLKRAVELLEEHQREATENLFDRSWRRPTPQGHVPASPVHAEAEPHARTRQDLFVVRYRAPNRVLEGRETMPAGNITRLFRTQKEAEQYARDVARKGPSHAQAAADMPDARIAGDERADAPPMDRITVWRLPAGAEDVAARTEARQSERERTKKRRWRGYGGGAHQVAFDAGALMPVMDVPKVPA